PPHFTVEAQHPSLVCRRVDGAATNACASIDEGQLMVFLQEDHHAVRQLHAQWLLRLERRQRRSLNLVPGLDLRGAEACEQKDKAEQHLYETRLGTFLQGAPRSVGELL